MLHHNLLLTWDGGVVILPHPQWTLNSILPCYYTEMRQEIRSYSLEMSRNNI